MTLKRTKLLKQPNKGVKLLRIIDDLHNKIDRLSWSFTFISTLNIEMKIHLKSNIMKTYLCFFCQVQSMLKNYILN